MILVDSSVWISYFNGKETVEVAYLNNCLGVKPVAIGDLILAEVLQGFRHKKHLHIAQTLFHAMPIHSLVGKEIAIKSADNYRLLRERGITIRKTIDCLIATYCIEHNLPLLQADKDFEAFHEYLGLPRALLRT